MHSLQSFMVIRTLIQTLIQSHSRSHPRKFRSEYHLTYIRQSLAMDQLILASV